MTDRYFQFQRVTDNPETRLFCFHYAGGSAFSYIAWKKFIDNSIDIYPYQMSGRGDRQNDGFSPDVETMVCEIAGAVKDYADRDIIFAGHSMGGMFAFHSALRLKEEYGINVKKLFITGSLPVLSGVLRKEFGYSVDMSEEEFYEMLLRFGAVSERMLKIQEFKEQFIPIIKSDLLLLDAFNPPVNGKISSDIEVYYGDTDKVADKDSVKLWNDVTDGKVSFTECRGGHFFIENYFREVCKDINNAIRRKL